MNRREAIAAGAALFVPQIGNAAQCPCVDKDKNATNPLERKHAQICAFHIGYDDPDFQLETTHYCTALGDGVFQCIIYDSCKPAAKLLGVEYVITNEVFGQLRKDEAKLWHPHRFEIEEGLFTIHNVTKDCEEKLLKALVNSWGKTWQTWPDPTTKVPLGKPILMWSASPTESVKSDLVKKRDKTYNLNVDDIKKYRKKLLGK
jgi:hypothetical protein